MKNPHSDGRVLSMQTGYLDQFGRVPIWLFSEA